MGISLEQYHAFTQWRKEWMKADFLLKVSRGFSWAAKRKRTSIAVETRTILQVQNEDRLANKTLTFFTLAKEKAWDAFSFLSGHLGPAGKYWTNAHYSKYHVFFILINMHYLYLLEVLCMQQLQ